MIVKFVLVFVIIVAISGLLVLLYLKAGLQLQYKNWEEKRPLGELKDFFIFDWKKGVERSKRIDAFLLFPLFFPIDLSGKKGQELILRENIRKVHLALYGAFIVLILVSSYTSKVFPDGIFS